MSASDNILEDKELFEYLGRALYVCQLLEVNLAHVIKDLHLLSGKIKGNDLLESLQNLQKCLDSRLETSKGMLGKLIKELKKDLPKFVPLDDDHYHLIDKALEKRNEIVHRFFYEHWIAMIVPVGRDVMIGDLKRIIRIISEAYELSQKIHDELLAKMKLDTNSADNVC